MAHAVDELERARTSHAERAWPDAYASFVRADSATPLDAEHLELLATAAYMIGRDDDYRNALERAYRAHADGGDPPRAARCAWWIGHNLLFHGETAPARGWFARGQRLLEREPRDCVELGYLQIPVMLQHSFGGDFEAARATAADIAELGERFGDRDLVAIALMEQGHALVKQGRAEDGLRLVDETMVAVTAGELSPIVAGIVYCNTIAFCRDAYELRRAREWTDALTRWCAQQPGMVAHQGLCLVHRAELMTLGGAWQDALEEASRVAERFTEGVLNERALGHAAYRRGEVHRLRGEFGEAETAYGEASRLGREPQPGLALLRLAEGNGGAAAASIRRAMSETTQQFKRAALLPAYVRIMVATGDVDAATVACRELEGIADRQSSEMLLAASAVARGEVALAGGEAQAALVILRRGWELWHELGAPYDAARARALLGVACRSLSDHDAAALELDAARATFVRLGAEPHAAWIDSQTGRAPATDTHGLTARELEVLRLVAAGKSNREIAAALVISERTVARHVQNIFAKLRVSSRTAASVFALEHELLRAPSGAK